MIQNMLHGDCLELMKDIPDGSIDMILCDLPYGITGCKWDIIIPFDKLWEQYERIIKYNGAIVLTASQPFTSALVMSNQKMFRYEWIYEKNHATGHLQSKKNPMKAHENILIFYKKLPNYNPQKTHNHKTANKYTKKVSVQNKTEMYGKLSKEVMTGGNTDRYPRSVLYFQSDKNKSSLHPTQKPVALFEYLIKTYTNENDLVLDNCAGSGTTAIACLNTNRQFIVMEKEQKYFDIINKRVKEHIIQTKLF